MHESGAAATRLFLIRAVGATIVRPPSNEAARQSLAFIEPSQGEKHAD
jgi:hypothetical protein